MADLNLEVNGFGLVNNAKLDINKINVVGGINSSGKSTVSRFLYSFLKANVLTSESYLKKIIIKEINHLINIEKETFSIDDDFSDVLKEYNNFKINNIKNSRIEYIDLLLKLSNGNKNYFTSSVLKDLINKENIALFEGGSSRLYSSTFESLIANEGVDAQFDEGGFVESYSDEYDCNSDLYVIKTDGFLDFPEIFYIDSFSILDLLHYTHYERNEDYLQKMDIINPKNHVNYLIDNIYDQSFFQSIKECDVKIRDVLDKINNIIQGHIGSHPVSLDFTFLKIPKIPHDVDGSFENPIPLLGSGKYFFRN